MLDYASPYRFSQKHEVKRPVRKRNGLTIYQTSFTTPSRKAKHGLALPDENAEMMGSIVLGKRKLGEVNVIT